MGHREALARIYAKSCTRAGRNFDEILRVIDALQLSARHRVATPANWGPGEDTVLLPFISDEEAERMFAAQGGVRKVRS